VLLDSPGRSRGLPTRSAPVCLLLPRSIRFVAPSSQARSSRRPSRFGLSSIATQPRVLHESGSCAGIVQLKPHLDALRIQDYSEQTGHAAAMDGKRSWLTEERGNMGPDFN